MNPTGRQRLDKWLWFARVVKTRTLAARLVTEGHVRINGQRQSAAAKPVAPGDVLTIALERGVKVLKVLEPGLRRGPFEEARLLYQDLSPPVGEQGPPGAAETDAGSGRPTKKNRRDIEKFREL